MLEKGSWKLGDRVYGLPKIKTIRIRIKKEKAEKTETAATVEGAAATPTTASETKEQATQKTAAASGKTQDKK